MTADTRAELIEAIRECVRWFPSYRMGQLVANYSPPAGDGPTDAQLLAALRGAVRQRRDRLDGVPPTGHDGDTLPGLLTPILFGLERLGRQMPESSFVELVRTVTDRAKGYAPFDTYDLEDEDFRRAVEVLNASPVAAAR
ncbi:MAG: hypothetical protein U0746_21400 [Gemmataceae bacterium]